MRWLILYLAFLAAVAITATVAKAGNRDLDRAARQVFGGRALVALCIAHYESTDGRYQYNGRNLGPWQIDVDAHPWVDRHRVVTDWVYSARVAYRISSGGRDWSPWTTHGLCGV